MHERIELNKKPRVAYSNLSPTKFTPKFQNNKTGGKFNKGKQAASDADKGNFRKSGPAPDQETLDKEMDDYMKKSARGLDSMLDDYMAAKKAPAQEAAAATETGAAVVEASAK